MKPICKSELLHTDKNNLIYNLFLICSSISLLVVSFVSLMNFFHKHCYRKYRYQYNTCNCGCQDDDYNCDDNNCSCE